MKRTYEQVAEALLISSSLRQLTHNLGYKISGGNCATVKKLLQEYDLPIPTGAGKGQTQTLESILVANSTYTKSNYLKTRLVNADIIKDECILCGTGPEWLGLPLTLQLDHINGDNRDNRLENLRVLCPNCHSQTATWGGRNVMRS